MRYKLEDGYGRPWTASASLAWLTLFAVLTCGIAAPLLGLLRGEGALQVGDNAPYALSDESDYTIPVHGEARGLMNSGIEIRQDLIGESSGQQQWAERLARIFGEIEAELKAEMLI